MNNIESFLRIVLWFHIAGGTLSLITGLGAMLTKKGGTTHRNFGRTYFWSMTVVFVTALILSVGHKRTFLLMVAFFSYYLTVRGYRMLYLKGLSTGQRANGVDWLIIAVSGIFIAGLFGWGIHSITTGDNMGIVGLVFGGIGAAFLSNDLKNFLGKRPEKMHWWYGHIASMGGSYIAAATAFIVVNISIPGFGWVLWILPSVIGSVLISRTIRHYKVKFSKV